jgi:hypothetical protein
MSHRLYSLHHPKIPIYKNLGDGRDTYISFYNGGFGSYKLQDTYLKEKTDSPKHYYYQNLALCKPTKRYFTDGGGRDLYVYNSLLDENDKCKGNVRLNNILRSYDNANCPMRTSKNLSPSKFEKKLLDRIFYGNSPGIKERLMSPKVKFLTKEDIRKRMLENSNPENLEDEKSTIYLDKQDKNPDSEERQNNRYKNNIYTVSKTDSNLNSMNNTARAELSNSLYNLKKTPKKYKIELGQNDHLVDSVKKIFLYNNNKNNKNKDKDRIIFNDIKIFDSKFKDLIKGPVASNQ